jgi:ribonuclease HIII
LIIIPVGSVEEARTKLIVKTYVSSNMPLEKQAEQKLRELEIELVPIGIKVVGSIQNGENYKRVSFTDFRDEIFVNAYFGKGGISVKVQPQNCHLRDLVQSVCDRLFSKSTNGSSGVINRSKYVVSDKDIQKRCEVFVFGLPDSVKGTQQDCSYRAKIFKNSQNVYVRQYKNGTLTIDGPNPLFNEIDTGIRSVLGVTIPSSVIDSNQEKLEQQIEAVKAVNLGEQWIGTDEAGKGDYFGPLVGAAVFIDNNLADQLAKFGVKDSKELSDSRNRELAIRISTICGKRAQVVMVPPSRYNQLYEQFKQEGKNLNTLLAWVHTRALEDILTAFPQNQITVIVDKFADEHYIKIKLLEKSRKTDLNLIQLPKAEANIAVAAASILARAQFLSWLDRMSQQLDMKLPKGASDPKIVQVAKQIVQTYGTNKLAEVAKLHFRTTKDIL